jgi:hypothetical protein
MRNAHHFLAKLKEMEKDRKTVLKEIKETARKLRRIRGRRPRA